MTQPPKTRWSLFILACGFMVILVVMIILGGIGLVTHSSKELRPAEPVAVCERTEYDQPPCEEVSNASLSRRGVFATKVASRAYIEYGKDEP